MSIVTCRRCSQPFDIEAEGGSTFYNAKGEVLNHAHTICRDHEEIARYIETGDMTNKVLEMAALLGHTNHLGQEFKDLLMANTFALIQAQAEQRDIHANIKVFEKQVWFNGLQKFIQGETRTGHSCEFDSPMGTVKFRCLAMCARWRATIEGPNGAFIDVITEEDGPEEGYPDMGISGYRMGLNGICATKDEAITLLDAATRAWAEGRINLEGSDVRIPGS